MNESTKKTLAIGGPIAAAIFALLGWLLYPIWERLINMIQDDVLKDWALLAAAMLVPVGLAVGAFISILVWFLPKALSRTKTTDKDNFVATEALPVDSRPTTNTQYEPRAQIQWMLVGDAPGVEIRAGIGMVAKRTASDEELTKDVITDRAVQLIRIINPDGEIVGKTFVRCSIIGPATILPLERRPFDDCLWDAHESEVIFVPRPTKPYGVVTSRGSFFRQCHFLQVAFMLLPDEIETIWNTSGFPKPLEPDK